MTNIAVLLYSDIPEQPLSVITHGLLGSVPCAAIVTPGYDCRTGTDKPSRHRVDPGQAQTSHLGTGWIQNRHPGIG